MGLAQVHHIHRGRGRSAMNPSTLLRFWEAFNSTKERQRGLHILQIGGRVGTWPSTVYRAEKLGYLYKTKDAHFAPTERMREEARRAQINRKRMMR